MKSLRACSSGVDADSLAPEHDCCCALLLQTALAKEFFDPVFQRAVMDVYMAAVLDGAERTVQEWCAYMLLHLYRHVTQYQGIFRMLDAPAGKGNPARTAAALATKCGHSPMSAFIFYLRC